MQKSPRILIIGAGTFGFSTAIVWLRKGYAVTLWDVDKQMIRIWRKRGYGSRYRWMKQYGLPDGLTLLDTNHIDCFGYDFVMLATSMSGLEPALKLIVNLDRPLDDHHQATLITVQKGLTEKRETPHNVVRRYFRFVSLLQYTGAGLGKGMAAGELTLMVIGTGEQYWEAAERFCALFDSTNIWCRLSQDPTGMCYGGVLRTIASGQLAIVRHLFRGKGATLAAVEAGIVGELWCLLRYLRPGSVVTKDGSPERKTIDADLRLPGTRSAKIGKLLAQGKSVEEALRLAGHDGAIEGYENVRRIYQELRLKYSEAQIAKDYPFLDNYYHMLWYGRTLDECKQSILTRQSSISHGAV